jgi:hypothetical protein
MSAPRPPLISLLEAVASGRVDLPVEAFGPRLLAWAIETGLGPLLFRALAKNPANAASPQWHFIKGADLTARVVTGAQFDAVQEIIDACRTKMAPLTLLKGISISEQCYPEPHLRLMRDVDLLVEKQSLQSLKGVLEKLGYRQRCGRGAEQFDHHHHLAPLIHKETGVWIEIHHGLLSPQRRASATKSFSRETLESQLRPSQFQGMEVRRLSMELQLVYLACHWAQDFQRVGGMVALVDAIYLLKHAGQKLSWEWILGSVFRSVAATYVYILLSYLDRYRLISIAPEILQELSTSQLSFGRRSLRAAHRVIDHYVVMGQAYGRLSSERTVSIVWKTLTLPGSTLKNLFLVPVNLSLPEAYRIQN